MASDFPMLDLTGLVNHYAKLWHGGRIPSDRASFIAMILADYMPEHCRAISQFTAAEWDQGTCDDRECSRNGMRPPEPTDYGLEKLNVSHRESGT